MDPHLERDLFVGEDWVVRLHQLEDEDVLFGTVAIFGLPCHAVFIRIVDDGSEQWPTRDPHDRWRALCEAEPEGVFRTVEVPGFEGEWVFFVTPFLQ